jgi:subtilase family serine protease
VKARTRDTRQLLSLFTAAVLLLVASPWNVDAQIISTVAGGGPVAGPALDTPLGTPTGVATDATGNFFIAAQKLNRVIKVDPSGHATMFAGASALGGFSGDGGAAASAGLNAPVAVAVDSNGNVYIADQANHRIRKVNATTGVITTVAGNGSAGFSGDGGPATSATLNTPVGVGIDSTGNIYIADQSDPAGPVFGRRVRKVNVTTGLITTVAGNGSSTFAGDGGLAINAGLTARGVATDSSGNLYIADQSNRRVRKVNTAGVITTVAGNGIPGFSGDGGLATNARLRNPFGVALDTAGNLYIADNSTQRVRKVDAGTGVIATVAGSGDEVPDFSGDGGAATSARLANPQSVAVDGSGKLLIADSFNQRVRQVDTTGDITTVAGNGFFGFNGDDGPAVGASLVGPPGVTVDSAGNLFIADQSNQRVRKVDAVTGVITTVAGNGSFDFSGDGGPAISAGLALPGDVAVDSGGNVFITDLSNRRVRRVDAVTGVITTVAGDGNTGFSGDGGPATSASFSAPSGVAVDSVGNLFIADDANQRVRRVDAATGVITTVAGNGTQGFSGDGGPATGASLSSPENVAVDSEGNLFIADLANHRVRRVDAVTGVITTVAGNGTAGFSGDGGPATSASLASPSGVAVDSNGDLFIADRSNQRVRKVDASSGVITTVAGSNALPGFSGDGGLATNARLADPFDVAVNSAGNVFIADFSNDRVRLVTWLPDLVERVLSAVPATAEPGTSFDVTDRIRNRGDRPASATTTRYYLSLNARKNRVDKRLAGTRAIPALDPGENSTGTVTVTIPRNTVNGTYLLLACADDVAPHVAESNERNNCGASDTTIDVARPPDLVEIRVSDPPANAPAGSTFRVTDKVKNRGKGPIAPTTTRYFLSTDTLRKGADQRLTGTRAVPALGPGDVSTGRVNVTIPRDTPSGTYFLLACADNLAPKVAEISELNNCSSSTATVQVIGRPDLVEVRVTDPPATATPGTSFDVTDRVSNRGTGPALETTTRYYLSLDQLRNTGDRRLTGSRAVPALDPGETSRGRVTVTIPTNTVPGTYFLIACADNAAPVVAESNERNNCRASAGTMIVGP